MADDTNKEKGPSPLTPQMRKIATEQTQRVRDMLQKDKEKEPSGQGPAKFKKGGRIHGPTKRRNIER